MKSALKKNAKKDHVVKKEHLVQNAGKMGNEECVVQKIPK